MANKKQIFESNLFKYMLMVPPVITLVMAGGYFEYVSCIMSILFFLLLGWLLLSYGSFPHDYFI